MELISWISMILVNLMTKMNSKKIISIAVAIAMSMSISGSALAFGSIDTLMQAKEKAEGFKEDAAAKGICLRIDEILPKTNERMSQKEEEINVRVQERSQNVEKNREQRDEYLTKFRTEADQWREDSYEKLESKAATDEQKAAVEKFKEVIETAIKTRRDAIDAAIDTFRDGVDAASADHKSSTGEVMNTYRNSVRTAFENAKSDCESGVDLKTIRANLHISLQAAKGQLKEDRAGAIKFRDSMQSLISAKKSAFEKAISDFKAAIKAAVAELKKSFPESSGDESAE